jgi:DNA-binding NtrC family response regulator
MNSIHSSKLGLVLLVDDDAGILFTFKLILEEEGYVVTAVDRGAAARKLLKERNYDAAVIDLNLEREGLGLELAEEAKNLRMPPAVVLYTGYPSIEQLRAALALKVDYLALKPVDVDEMKAALLRLVARRANNLAMAAS